MSRVLAALAGRSPAVPAFAGAIGRAGLAALALPAALWAQGMIPLTTTSPPPPAEVIQPAPVMNLSLVEALIAVDAADLAGVFAYVPEPAAPSAMADYLLHNRRAFKKFVKKGRRDLKDAGGVNGWDRAVYMVILSVNNSAVLPPGVERLSTAQEEDLSELVLARPMSLQEMTAAKATRR